MKIYKRNPDKDRELDEFLSVIDEDDAALYESVMDEPNGRLWNALMIVLFLFAGYVIIGWFL